MQFPEFITIPTHYPRIVLSPDREIEELEQPLKKYDTERIYSIVAFALFCGGFPLALFAFKKPRDISPLIYVGPLGAVALLFLSNLASIIKLKHAAEALLAPTRKFLKDLKNRDTSSRLNSGDQLFMSEIANRPASHYKLPCMDPKSNDEQTLILLNQIKYYDEKAQIYLEKMKEQSRAKPDAQDFCAHLKYNMLMSQFKHPDDPNQRDAIFAELRELNFTFRTHLKMYFIFRMRAIYCAYVCEKYLMNSDLALIHFPKFKCSSWSIIAPIDKDDLIPSLSFVEAKGANRLPIDFRVYDLKGIAHEFCVANQETFILENLFLSISTPFKDQNKKILPFFHKLVDGAAPQTEENKE